MEKLETFKPKGPKMTKSKLAEAAKDMDSQKLECRKDVMDLLDKVYPIEKYHNQELPNRGSLAVHFCRLAENKFESGAQWYERSLEGVGVEGCKRVTFYESPTDGAFSFWEGSFRGERKVDMIEALPVQALIASQTAEIERLRKALEDAIEAIEATERYVDIKLIKALYADKARVLKQALGAKDE
jgi:hypothetical protein